MNSSGLGGGFLSGPSAGILDMESPFHRHQQTQLGHPPSVTSHQHMNNIMSGLENDNPIGLIEVKNLNAALSFGKGKGIALSNPANSNDLSEDDEPSYAEDGNCENLDGTAGKGKKGSPWQRMKWMDNVVGLLIAVVSCVADDGTISGGGDGVKRKSGVLQKKGKWKTVSKIMINKGCHVSPQQCEDKFNDLNKRYKRLNTETMQRFKMGFPDYIQALEEERRKIQVFPKELPLSLELITQAIETCRKQLSGTTTEYNLNGQSECSEQTTSTEGPVLEEFIPIKKRASSYCEEDDEDEQHSSHKQQKIPKDNNNNKNNDKRKSDWLRSVQLWNPDPPSEDVTRKVPVVELKRSGSGGGAFQPFHKEERASKTSESLSKAPSSTAVTVTSNNAGSSKKEEKEGQRKQRRCWSQELHKRFLQALQQLGGADTATPKQIRELMNVDGLTNDEVKSHLQKYRLHSRRPSSTGHDNANSQTAAPFVLVGNIFVQPPEYAAVGSSTASGELTKVVTSAGIYAPVATHPPAVSHTPAASIKRPEFKKVEFFEHSNSEERANHSEGAVHSNSPASSSSTHTTTTSSPGY